MQRHVIAIALGGVIGVSLVWALFDYPIRPEWAGLDVLNRYNGPVLEEDVANHSMTVMVPSAYVFTGSSQPTRFTYDDDTVWSSFHFYLKDNVVTERPAQEEEPRSLTPGTLVLVRTYPDSLHARSITFLRRTEL